MPIAGLAEFWNSFRILGFNLDCTACFAVRFLTLIDLGETATIDANVSFSFGLEVTIEASFNYVVEVIMNNSLVLHSCVWFGVWFLRA
jgi:hypothetical protein